MIPQTPWKFDDGGGEVWSSRVLDATGKAILYTSSALEKVDQDALVSLVARLANDMASGFAQPDEPEYPADDACIVSRLMGERDRLKADLERMTSELASEVGVRQHLEMALQNALDNYARMARECRKLRDTLSAIEQQLKEGLGDATASEYSPATKATRSGT